MAQREDSDAESAREFLPVDRGNEVVCNQIALHIGVWDVNRSNKHSQVTQGVQVGEIGGRLRQGISLSVTDYIKNLYITWRMYRFDDN